MIATSEDRVLAEMEAPAGNEDPDGETNQQAERLVAAFDGNREGSSSSSRSSSCGPAVRNPMPDVDNFRVRALH